MAAKDDQELSLFHVAAKKLSDAQKLTDEAHDLLKQATLKMPDKKNQISNRCQPKTLKEVHFGSSVKLNVGGKIYKTTLDTLRKDPDSMLCAMFSGRHELKPDEEDGAYFIDRDGKLFRYILNYLRDGELLCPDDKTIQKQVLREAEFYQVQGIIAQLEKETLPNPLKSSVIIKDDSHVSAVMSWLPPGATCSLLFRATTDGTTPKDFHRCCDNKGPTLVVIKSGEYICGGYTSKSWTSPECYTNISDSQSYLFTLVNPSGDAPINITQNPGASGGILCRRDRGPIFGGKTNCDLVVWGGAPTGHINLGNGFTCPGNGTDGNTCFTGTHPFEITELEVLKIDF